MNLLMVLLILHHELWGYPNIWHLLWSTLVSYCYTTKHTKIQNILCTNNDKRHLKDRLQESDTCENKGYEMHSLQLNEFDMWHYIMCSSFVYIACSDVSHVFVFGNIVSLELYNMYVQHGFIKKKLELISKNYQPKPFTTNIRYDFFFFFK